MVIGEAALDSEIEDLVAGLVSYNLKLSSVTLSVSAIFQIVNLVALWSIF
jgi:hypothetical protein